MGAPDKTVARQVIYRGQVQGVGFRFTVLRFARMYDSVTGYVRNRADGSVEVHAEGEESEVESLLEDIATGPHARHIRDVTAQSVPPSGRNVSFEVAY